MTARRFFSIAIWAPLVVPALLFLPGLPGGTIVETLLSSLVMAGLPYFIFALYFRSWLADQAEPAIVRRMWLTPLLFAPLAWLGGFGLLTLIFGLGIVEAAELGVFMVGYELLIGYCYVIVFMAFYYLVRDRRAAGSAAAA